jgi:hypothetical protein
LGRVRKNNSLKLGGVISLVQAGAILFGVILSTSAHAADRDYFQGFTFQGKLYNDDGVTPLMDTVTLDFEVYDPAGNCKLYHHRVLGVDLVSTGGSFAVEVGSVLGSAARVVGSDPGLSMSAIFSNQATAGRLIGSSGCSLGYTPVSGDARRLRVTVTPNAGTSTTLSPDYIIGSVPTAVSAQNLQGLVPSQILQTNVGANLSQLSLETLTNGSDASSLHHHDALYLKAATAGTQNLGSGVTTTTGSVGVGTAAPTARVDVVSTDAAAVGLNISNSGLTAVGARIVGSASGTGNLLELRESENSTPLARFDSEGNLFLPVELSPVSGQAVTKNYVDAEIANVSGSAGSTYLNKDG